MTIESDRLESAARFVKLTSRDWRAIVTLLITALIFIGGTAYAIAAHVVESKVTEIKESATRIAALEKSSGVMQEQLNNQSKSQDRILSELTIIASDLKNISVSVAKIEGRDSVQGK